MPVRFTCRVLVFQLSNGNLRVRYGHPSEKDVVRGLVLHGLKMLLPPDQEMTPDEYKNWETGLLAAGFQRSWGMRSDGDGKAMVEITRTYEDEIPRGAVQARLGWVEDGPGTLSVEVASSWTQEIPAFSLSLDYQHALQPLKVGNTVVRTAGGSDAMFRPIDGLPQGDLWPRKTRVYALDTAGLAALRSRAASLSPEDYWLSLRTDDYEFDRVGGRELAEFLDAAPDSPANC